MSKAAYVLVAEPDKAVAAALARVASDATKLPCRVVSDGSEGHALLVSDGAPSLLITDLTLPKRDGFSLIRGLRRCDPTRKARVIALSAFPAVRKSAQDLQSELAPIDVLAKPVALSAVERLLRDKPIETKTEAIPTPTMRPAMPPMAAPTDAARVARIRGMGIVDEAPPDEELQRIVSEVAASFGVPTALVTVVLENEQWFKSYVGLGGDLLAKRGGPRTWAFCHHVVEGRDALVVADARENPVFANNPYVKDGTIRGYAGAPIVTPQGDVLGSMCIIDTKPLDVGAEAVARLRLVARRVAGELQLAAARRKKRIPNASEAPGAPPEREDVLRALDVAMETMPCGVVVFDDAKRTVSSNTVFCELFGVRRADVVGTRRETLLSRIATSFAEPDDVLLRLVTPSGAYALCEELPLAKDGRVVRWSATPIEIPGGLVQVVSVS